MKTTIYIDEVGMGSIFGCLATCAVAIGSNVSPIPGVTDSKKLTKNKRQKLYNILSESVEHAFGFASPQRIEDMNVFWARHWAAKVAINKLFKRGVKADKIIIDGKFTIPDLDFPQEAVVKGDEKFWQIGAASILAKVKRDNMMTKLGKLEKYSLLDLANNAGYSAPKHRVGVILGGPTFLHRKKFKTFKDYLFHYERCQEFMAKGHTAEDYLRKVDEKKGGRILFAEYVNWKDGKFAGWRK